MTDSTTRAATVYTVERMPRTMSKARSTSWQIVSSYHGEPIATNLTKRGADAEVALMLRQDAEAQREGRIDQHDQPDPLPAEKVDGFFLELRDEGATVWCLIHDLPVTTWQPGPGFADAAAAKTFLDASREWFDSDGPTALRTCVFKHPEPLAVGEFDLSDPTEAALAQLADPISEPDHVATAIERSKREILADIASGRVPASVADFADLHDYVDANEYGGLCSDKPWVDDEGGLDMALTDASSEVQEAVHRWLVAGRPGAEAIDAPLAAGTIVEVVVRVRATTEADASFTAQDLFDAVSATLHEVFPSDAAPTWPIVPEVTRATPYGTELVSAILDGDYPDFTPDGYEVVQSEVAVQRAVNAMADESTIGEPA